ncbi:MAG: MSCRAMM family protein, partial [Sphingorhabdus sp.]
ALSASVVPAFADNGQSGWKANDDDQLLLDVRAGKWRVGDGVRGYQTDAGICVDFADIIIAFDLPIRLDKKSRRATGWLFEENRTFTLDREAKQVQIMNKASVLSKSDIHDTPEGWCIDSKTLGRWLNVTLTPDLNDALLIVQADRKLPFELAEERKERAAKVRPTIAFDLKALPQAKDPYRFWRTPSIDVVTSTGFARESRGPAKFNARYDIFASGEIARASFDARLSSNDKGAPEAFRMRAYRTSVDANLLGPLKATHFGVGDVSLPTSFLGAQSSPGRGMFITNRPLARPDNFDRTSFRGELPDGWDAELYRNDQLIGYFQSRGNGRYEFLDIPLLYGQNCMEVVLYGPQGQIRRDVRMIPVGANSIPPRETYYWAGVQDAGRDLINFGNSDVQVYNGWRAGFGIERGLDAKTSIGAAAISSVYLGERNSYLEAMLRRAIGPTLVELASAANIDGGYALRGQMLGQFGEILVGVQSLWQFDGFQSEQYLPGLRQEHTLSFDHSLRIGAKSVPYGLNAVYRKWANGTYAYEAKARLSFNINKISASTDFIWEQTKSAFGTDPPARFDTILRLSGRAGGLRLRGEARFALAGGDIGFKESRITGEWRANEKANWRAELGYDATNRRGRASFGYTRQFEKFALTGQVMAATDGAIAGQLSLAFSLGPNPYGEGLHMSADKLASSGQAAVLVYQDLNADGFKQQGEPIEKSVEITAGNTGRGRPTDERGQTLIAMLEPYVPILIGVDTESLPDPYMQPAYSGKVITPRPGVPIIVELPLVSSGEISGYLIKEGGKILGGVDIELLDKAGRRVKVTRSEYDGFFLFESVPYGEYGLRIAAIAANVVGIQTEIAAIARLDKSNPTLDLGQILLKPATRIAANE